MPRIPTNSPNEIYEALKELWFLDNIGKFLPWIDDIWQKTINAMQNKISKDYIYLYLSKNRNDVFNRIYGVNTCKSIKNESSIDIE